MAKNKVLQGVYLLEELQPVLQTACFGDEHLSDVKRFTLAFLCLVMFSNTVQGCPLIT